MGSAGRTVTFSGLTVLVSLSCLLLFPFPFLRSFAYAGVGTVLTAVFAALVILPAALTRLGHRVARKGPWQAHPAHRRAGGTAQHCA